MNCNSVDDEDQENYLHFPINIVKNSEKQKSRLGRRKNKSVSGSLTHPFTPSRSLSYETKQPEALKDIANILQEPNPVLNDSFVSDSNTSTSVTDTRTSGLSESFKTPGRSFYFAPSEESPLDPLKGILESPRGSSTLYFPHASTVKKSNALKTLFGKADESSDKSFGVTSLDKKRHDSKEYCIEDVQVPVNQKSHLSSISLNKYNEISHKSCNSTEGSQLLGNIDLDSKCDLKILNAKRHLEVDHIDGVLKQEDSLYSKLTPLNHIRSNVVKESLTESAKPVQDQYCNRTRLCKTQDSIKTPFSTYLSKNSDAHDSQALKPIPGIEQIAKNFSAHLCKSNEPPKVSGETIKDICPGQSTIPSSFIYTDTKSNTINNNCVSDDKKSAGSFFPNRYCSDNLNILFRNNNSRKSSNSFPFLGTKGNDHMSSDSLFKKNPDSQPIKESFQNKFLLPSNENLKSEKKMYNQEFHINRINTVEQFQDAHVPVTSNLITHHSTEKYSTPSNEPLNNQNGYKIPEIGSKSCTKAQTTISPDSGVLTSDSLHTGESERHLSHLEPKSSDIDNASLKSLSLSSSSSGTQQTIIPQRSDAKNMNSIFQASLLKNEYSIIEGSDVPGQGPCRSNIFHSSIIKPHHEKEEKHNSYPFSTKERAFKRSTSLQSCNRDSILKGDLINKVSDNVPFSSTDRLTNHNSASKEILRKEEHHKKLSSERHQDNMFKKPANIVSRQGRHNSNLPDKITVNGIRYPVLSLLGKGGSSEVYQALGDGSELVAIKCVNLESVDKVIADGYLNEIKQLENLQMSQSVIKMFNHEYKKQSKTLLVVMEKGDIDFADLIKSITKTKRISVPMIIYYWTEMLTCVNDIHANGVIHSDLKPANFLLVGGRLKLIDFGIASSIQEDMTSVVKDVAVGTFNYISPEAIINNSETSRGHKISFKSDVWSLGCILYQLLYGKTPYSHIHPIWTKMQAIADMKCTPTYPKDIDIPFGLEIALKWCLNKDPRKRPTTSQLMQIPYYPPTQAASRGMQFKSLLYAEIMEMFPECPVIME